MDPPTFLSILALVVAAIAAKYSREAVLTANRALHDDRHIIGCESGVFQMGPDVFALTIVVKNSGKRDVQVTHVIATSPEGKSVFRKFNPADSVR